MATEESIQAIRALDESSLARSYWHFYWEDERSHWYEETVNDDGEECAVKQLVVDADDSIHRYWWRHIEDEAGGLADQAIDPTSSDIERITADAFFDLWGTPGIDRVGVSSRMLAQASASIALVRSWLESYAMHIRVTAIAWACLMAAIAIWGLHIRWLAYLFIAIAVSQTMILAFHIWFARHRRSSQP